MHFRVRSQPWRLAPAWCLLAGVLLAGDWTFTANSLLRLLLALLLVDPAWGALWSQMTHFFQESAAVVTPRLLPLPYARAEAPATRLWQWLHRDGETGRGADTLLAFLMTGALSLVLRPAGIVASTLAALLTLAAAADRHHHPSLVRLAQAVLAVALPWWLGANLFTGESASLWPRSSDRELWFLAVGFTLLAFGMEQALAGAGRLWFWGAHLLLVIGLVAVGEPLAAGAAGLILLIPSLRLWPGSTTQLRSWLLLALGVTLLIVVSA